MKSGRFGIILTGVVTVGALALVVLRPSVVGEAVYPVERAVSLLDRAALSRVTGLFAGASAAAENVRLKREVRALSLLRGDCERLRVENARLRRVLDFRARRRRPGFRPRSCPPTAARRRRAGFFGSTRALSPG